MTIEEAMTGLYRRLINRRQNPEGKVYIPTDQVDLIANNKAIENTLFEQIGSREDATKVPSFNGRMKRPGLQLLQKMVTEQKKYLIYINKL